MLQGRNQETARIISILLFGIIIMFHVIMVYDTIMPPLPVITDAMADGHLKRLSFRLREALRRWGVIP